MLVLIVLPATTAAQMPVVSVEEEIDIGRQANAQVRKGVPEVRDAEAIRYVRGLGHRLVRQAPGPAYLYSFSLADHGEIHASALPGGPVWIHSGVLHAATSESQVASVLAHEIAHIAQRHAADQLPKAAMANLGLGLLGVLLGNGGGANAAQTAAGFLANGVFLKFSRDDEREADQVGLQMMRRAGWDARGMVELFEILQREAQRDPGAVETFFSSHPPRRDCIARLQADVAQNRGGRATVRSSRS